MSQCDPPCPKPKDKGVTADGLLLGSLVTSAANAKRRKYGGACSLAGFGFEPFSVDVCGLIDKNASDRLRCIASMYAAYHNKPLTYSLAIVRR